MLIGATIGVLYLAYDLGYDRAYAKAQIQTQKMINEIEADWRKKYQDGVEKAEALQKTIDNIEVETRIVKERVEIYVEPDKDEYCGPSIGIVGVLNDAKNSELSASPILDVDYGRTASGIDYSELIHDEIDTIEAYNKLMARHNTLVKWIEDNYEN